jgi:hypothetical protein
MDARQEAKRLFNETWNYLDNPDRTEEDDIQMLHMAHTSAYLWQSCGEAKNFARGEWQVSRVYSTLKMGELALLHGRRSLEICLDNGLEGVDLVFGYEAVARAYTILGDGNAAEEYKSQGAACAESILDEDDRQYVLCELDAF